MATQMILMYRCDNCGAAQESVERFTIAHRRTQRVVEAGADCGCCDKLSALMEAGRVATVTVNGRKRGRPTNTERAARLRRAGSSLPDVAAAGMTVAAVTANAPERGAKSRQTTRHQVA